jgi:hypothetical protein|tara:strand:- start:4277 stop:4585 length:309 start_codon:yes stop_codon:yes gene_type:complete
MLLTEVLESPVDQKEESWRGAPATVTVATLVERIINLSNQVEALRVSEERRHGELRVELKDRYATKADIEKLKAGVAVWLLATIVGAVVSVGIGVAIVLATT